MGVLVICVLVFTVFCIVCTVFFVFFLLCIFLFVLFVLVLRLLTPSDNSIAVSSSSGNKYSPDLAPEFSTSLEPSKMPTVEKVWGEMTRLLKK